MSEQWETAEMLGDWGVARAAIAPPLTVVAAALARRLANVLRTNLAADSGAAEADFLDKWADSTGAPATDLPLPVPLQRLADGLGLDPVEIELIVLAGLPEEHEGLAATFRSLHPTHEPRPTLGLAAQLRATYRAEPTAVRDQLRRTITQGPACASGLLTAPTDSPLFERSLRLADGVWPALHGYDAWPAGLARLDPGSSPTGLQDWLDELPSRRAIAAIAASEPAVVLVTSEDEAIAVSRCSALAARAGAGVVAARVDPQDATRVALLSLHALLRGSVPVVVAPPLEPHRQALPVGRVRSPLLVCAAPGVVRPATSCPVVWLPTGPVSTEDQRSAWRDALPGLPREQENAIVGRHRLDPAVTAQLGRDLQHLEDLPSPAEVSSMVRTRLSTTLPPGVDLVTPDVPLSDVVLSGDGASQLADAVARLDHQVRVLDEWGLRRRAHALEGARLLLCGPPGTGKSLAARAVATEAATDLLVVDVSRIVSKWLGETEKNLGAAFDAAERTQAVLMLDEADSLFGTRTEISDAHDRYANLETAYLLARLDRFEGLVILTTNMRSNIDPAFLRRIDFLVEFPLPNRTQRVDLWHRHLPTSQLGADVDLDALAGLYPVTGAWIRNASVGAAFAAAADAGVVTQAHLVDAVQREYLKAALPFPGVPPRRRP
jgi:hypothetical protein